MTDAKKPDPIRAAAEEIMESYIEPENAEEEAAFIGDIEQAIRREVQAAIAQDREERESSFSEAAKLIQKPVPITPDPLSAKLERLREIHGVVTIILDEDGMSIYGRKHKMGCDFCNKDYAQAVDAAMKELEDSDDR